MIEISNPQSFILYRFVKKRKQKNVNSKGELAWRELRRHYSWGGDVISVPTVPNPRFAGPEFPRN